MIIKKIVDIIDGFGARLLDVFITGPIRIYISQYIHDDFLKKYIIIEGISVILFNLYNYLHKKNGFTLNIPYINTYNHPTKGKPQIHRLYNLFVMYPLHIYIIRNYKIDTIPKNLFIVVIIFNIIYNSYNYMHYYD